MIDFDFLTYVDKFGIPRYVLNDLPVEPPEAQPK